MSMSEGRRVNKSHPDFEKYWSKCEDLWEKYRPQIDTVETEGRKKYPDWKGRDCPWGDRHRELERKMYAELKALQEEYSYLFTKNDNDD